MKIKYRRCYAVYTWQVMCDNKVMIETRNKDEAEIILEHHLRQKHYDNIYMKKITRVRYTLVD